MSSPTNVYKLINLLGDEATSIADIEKWVDGLSNNEFVLLKSQVDLLALALKMSAILRRKEDAETI